MKSRLKIYSFRLYGDYASGVIVVVAGTDKKALELAKSEHKSSPYLGSTFDEPDLRSCEIKSIQTGIVSSWGYAE